MNNNLFKKYYFTTICLMLAFILFLVLAFSISAGNFIANDKRKLLDKNCDIAADFYQNNVKDGNLSLFYSMLQISARAGDCDMFISDDSGRVVCCSCADWQTEGYCVHSVNKMKSSILEKSQKEEGYFEVGNLGGVYKKSNYTSAKSLKNADGESVGVIFASVPASELQTLYVSLLRMVVVAAIIPVCLILAFAYATSLRLTRPLKMMSAAAKAMAKGDFSKRIPVRGNDEITELSKSFNEMTNSLSQLEYMRRSFVANVSHELKTPMTTIGGFIDGMLDGTIDREHQNHYLQIVSDEVKRLSRLVQSMLNLSRLESGEQKPNFTDNDLCEIVLSTVLSFEQAIEKKNIEIRGLDTLPSAVAKMDADLMHQIIYNLVDNSVKFTDAGGYIAFTLQNRGAEIAFVIRNSGKGIPEKDLPHIFERFYKSDRSRSSAKESTGLGLYIVKSIVEIHHGKIIVRSKENAHTEFELIIPKK
ncbi:MAG: HAMP domain-containing histidine kinase [Clostridia bacterium]|nr:HAMP domain-containing histidine kinase [Clostridia bacterium]